MALPVAKPLLDGRFSPDVGFGSPVGEVLREGVMSRWPNVLESRLWTFSGTSPGCRLRDLADPKEAGMLRRDRNRVGDGLYCERKLLR